MKGYSDGDETLIDNQVLFAVGWRRTSQQPSFARVRGAHHAKGAFREESADLLSAGPPFGMMIDVQVASQLALAQSQDRFVPFPFPDKAFLL